MRVMIRSGWLVVVALGWGLLATDGGARTGDLNRDPADLVRLYVTLDSKGSRLDSISYEALRPYVNWTEEPVWGHAVVIDGVEVIDDIKQWEIVSNTEVVIPVRYRTLGAVYWNTASFIPEPQVEVVGFKVKAVTSRWKITEPLLPPHVTRQRFLNHVRLALMDEANPLHRQALDTLHAELKRLK